MPNGLPRETASHLEKDGDLIAGAYWFEDVVGYDRGGAGYLARLLVDASVILNQCLNPLSLKKEGDDPASSVDAIAFGAP